MRRVGEEIKNIRWDVKTLLARLASSKKKTDMAKLLTYVRNDNRSEEENVRGLARSRKMVAVLETIERVGKFETCDGVTRFVYPTSDLNRTLQEHGYADGYSGCGLGAKQNWAITPEKKPEEKTDIVSFFYGFFCPLIDRNGAEVWKMRTLTPFGERLLDIVKTSDSIDFRRLTIVRETTAKTLRGAIVDAKKKADHQTKLQFEGDALTADHEKEPFTKDEKRAFALLAKIPDRGSNVSFFDGGSVPAAIVTCLVATLWRDKTPIPISTEVLMTLADALGSAVGVSVNSSRIKRGFTDLGRASRSFVKQGIYLTSISKETVADVVGFPKTVVERFETNDPAR